MHSSEFVDVNSTEGIKKYQNRKRMHQGVLLNFKELPKSSSSTSDHTPTPTRFIRNCEEVGLFQDLQNVNPFEEGFRNALNDTNSGTKNTGSLKTHQTNNDDTLHTPNILPLISSVYSLADKESINEVIDLDTSHSDDSDCEWTIVCDDDNEKEQETESHSGTGDHIKEQEKHEENTQNMKSVKSRLNVSKELKPRKDIDVYDKNTPYQDRRRAQNKRYKEKARIKEQHSKKWVLGEISRLQEENEQLKAENSKVNVEVKELRRQIRVLSSNIIFGGMGGNAVCSTPQKSAANVPKPKPVIKTTCLKTISKEVPILPKPPALPTKTTQCLNDMPPTFMPIISNVCSLAPPTPPSSSNQLNTGLACQVKINSHLNGQSVAQPVGVLFDNGNVIMLPGQSVSTVTGKLY